MEREFIVRSAERPDAEHIAEFNLTMAFETEGVRLDGDELLAGVRSVFDHPDRGFYLVADFGGEVAGSLMVTTEWSDWRNSHYWWIQSVYVKPQFRRRGVYSALYARVKELAAQSGVHSIRLYAETANHTAHETYRSVGMREKNAVIFEEELK